MLAASESRLRGLAVLLTLAAPAAGQGALEPRVVAALDRARPVLQDLAQHTTGGVHALVCLALAHDGLTRKDPRFRAALDRLASTRLSQTYDLSLRLMVMAKVTDFPNRRTAAQRDLRQLLRHQWDGGFTYTDRGGRWDLSNTQYAALGMRAAASLGVRIPRQHWQAMARAVLTGQVYRGGFSYRGKGSGTPSMTVAGIAVLEVCQQQLQSKGTLARQIRWGIDQAWSYMVANRRTIGAGACSQRNYYYHYGLERAAILSDRQQIGDVDWYRTGASMLLDQQDAGGGWSPGRPRRAGRRDVRPPIPAANAIETAFAVLFLRRSFQRTLTGPITPARNVLVRDLGAQASEASIRAAVALEIARGYRAVPDLIRAMRSPLLTRRKAVALALPAITGRFHSYSPYARPGAAAAVIKAAELWWLREGARLLRKSP